MLIKKSKLLCSILILLTIGLVGCTPNNNEVEEKEEVKADPVKKSITISFAGDVTMGNYIGSTGVGTFDYEVKAQNNDYSYFFRNVKDIFENDDLTIVNLEGPLTTSTNGDRYKKFAFKGDPSYVNILKAGDIEAVTLANNHSEDYFTQGLEDTKKVLDEAGIKYAGMGEKSIIETNGINVGFLAYKGWNDDEATLKQIKKEIEEMKKESNTVIVYYHWGNERENYPNETQKKIARFSVDSGADLVIGSHPHVLQGIEYYKNKDGEDKIIAYSLGNFSFGGNKNPSDKDSVIYQQTLNFEDGKLVSLDTPNLIPCSISSVSYRNNFQPTPLEGDNATRVLNRIKKYSENIN